MLTRTRTFIACTAAAIAATVGAPAWATAATSQAATVKAATSTLVRDHWEQTHHARAAGFHAVSLPAPPIKTRLSVGRHVCYDAHVQNIGWQGWVCDGAVAGTTGMSLRMEALAIYTVNVGGICADAHVQNIGWQGWTCASDGHSLVVGTTGLSLRMEALALLPSTGTTCANAHVQNIGWQGWACGPAITVGTTGMSLRMEAIQITV